MSRYDDEFDDGDSVISRLMNGFGVRHGVLALAIIAVIGGGVWALSSGDGGGSAGNVPMVTADNAPYKVAPDEIGGMAVPNQKSTIFETLKGHDETAGVENLLADDEQPMVKADIPEPQKEPEIKTAMVDATADTTKPEPVPAPPEADEVAKTEPAAAEPIETKQVEAKPVEEKPEVKPEVKIVEPAKEEPKAEPKKEEPKPEIKKQDEPKVESKTGSKSLQFAAVKSDAEARNLWKKLQGQNPELSAYTLRVQKADLGEKGTYYRVQIAGLSDDKAASLCAKIKSRGASCMVVK